MQESSPFSISSPAFIVCSFFNDSHSDWCKVIPYCTFDLHFFNNELYWASFHVFVGHLYAFFGEMYIYVFNPCFDFGLFVFLVLSCMSWLYILEINHLSVVSFAIIFFHSSGCLLFLFIVSFAVQKLLSLIKPHLLTFVFISITVGSGSKRILLWCMSKSVPQCSLQHFLQQLGHGSNLDVHQQMNGYRNCGTYIQWNITQL